MNLPAHDVSPLSGVQSLGAEVQMLHARHPLPVLQLEGRSRDGLPGHGAEELHGEGVLVGPGESVPVSRLRHQLLVVAVELPNLKQHRVFFV